MKKRIWLSPPHMGGDEIKYVQEAFDTNWIAPVGPHIPAFEKDIEQYVGEGIYAAALQSGTAALHLALKLCGISRRDEVICPTLSFIASANPIIYESARPVFIDSERFTWNMCPQALEDAIVDRIKSRSKPKAIIVVHLYGMPADLDRIMAVSDIYNIPVIEDAAEALGSEYRGRRVGSFGKIAVLSFNGNKIITTSGGGAFLSKDNKLVEKARYLSTQARDEALHYEHSQTGYNYRLSNVCAGIGRGQMNVINERVAQRRQNFEYYRARLQQKGIQFVDEPSGSYFSNRWLTTVLFPEPSIKELVIKALSNLDIESRPIWKPLHLQPVFLNEQYYGENRVAEDLFSRGLCLPSGSNIASDELEMICDEIEKII